MAERFPLIAHFSPVAGDGCCGNIDVIVADGKTRLLCNECGALVGTIDPTILAAILDHISEENIDDSAPSVLVVAFVTTYPDGSPEGLYLPPLWGGGHGRAG